MNFVYYEQASTKMIEKYRMYEEREMKRNGGYLYDVYVLGYFHKFFNFTSRYGYQDIFLDDESECYFRIGSSPGYIGGKHSYNFLLYINNKKILFTIKQENNSGEYDEENIKLVWIWDKGEKKIEEMTSVLPLIKEVINAYFIKWQEKKINITFNF